VKHAGPAALAQLEPLLADVRRMPAVVERSPGTFSVRSRAFLHFHEDPEGLFADLRLEGDDFVRYPVTTREEQQALVRMIAAAGP